jgi:hypothetical protein
MGEERKKEQQGNISTKRGRKDAVRDREGKAYPKPFPG